MERSIMSRTILTILQYQYSNLLRGSHWRSSKAEKNHCNNVETCWFTILWLLFIYLGLRYAIKGEDVLPNIWNLKRIIRGLFLPINLIRDKIGTPWLSWNHLWHTTLETRWRGIFKNISNMLKNWFRLTLLVSFQTSTKISWKKLPHSLGRPHELTRKIVLQFP